MSKFSIILIICCLVTSASNLQVTEIDLTWPFDEKTMYWIDHLGSTVPNSVSEFNQYSKSFPTNDFCAERHGGTYFEAPNVFNKNGWRVGEVPLSRLIATGIKIDISIETDLHADTALLLPEHIQHWEELHGSIPDHCILLVRFGWSKYYEDKIKYLGLDKHNHFNFPGVSEEAIEFIIQLDKIVGVGIDTASIDPGNSSNFFAHKLLAKNQIYIMENLFIPENLPDRNFDLYVMPMKLEDGTGAPLRIIAIIKGSKFSRYEPQMIPRYANILVICSMIIFYIVAEINAPDYY